MVDKIKQVYGYLVCIVSIITFVIAIAGLINALIDLSDPMYAGYQSDINLTSFESYKVSVMQHITKEAAYIPKDGDIQAMYAAARQDALARAAHRTKRDLIVNSIVLAVAIGLFLIHWRWLGKLGKSIHLKS